MPSTAELPDDPRLPALAAIRDRLGQVIPERELGDGPVEIRLCNHVPGSRATFEVRTGERRLALKAYAEDPTPEAELYRHLARVGLAGVSSARVPRLLAVHPTLRVLVMEWLDGPSLSQLVRRGDGERAGRLAASWLWHASRRRVKRGPPCGTGRLLYQVGVSVAALGASDRDLGAAAKVAAKSLVRSQPRERSVGLVHGTLYARHILDLGDGPGVIDWQQFGQGPVEVDAGMFLATISRLALRHPDAADAAARAEETFVSRTRGLVDPLALDWYRAAGLLHLAASGLKTGLKRSVPPEAHALVAEAARRAAPADAAPALVFRETPRPFARIRSAFTIRPRTPSLVQPAGPAATTQPDPNKARGIGGTKPR